MNYEDKIYIPGHNGLVGSAIVRNLKSKGFHNIITISHGQLDLRDQTSVEDFFAQVQPDFVFMAAAKVGGITANINYPAEFIRDNLLIQTNIIHSAFVHQCKKLLFLGSSCIYPKFSNQPITEDQLLTGILEPTNEPYAIAKIAGIKMCQAYRKQYGFNTVCCMPTNLYGPNDNFDENNSHVLPAFIARFHQAKVKQEPYVECWGDGSAMREFLYVDDLAKACYVIMSAYDGLDIINVGAGKDIKIKHLANEVAKMIGYDGEIRWDISKPNGTPRKVMSVDRIKSLGWKPSVSLMEGIQKTYNWYVEKLKNSLVIC